MYFFTTQDERRHTCRWPWIVAFDVDAWLILLARRVRCPMFPILVSDLLTAGLGCAQQCDYQTQINRIENNWKHYKCILLQFSSEPETMDRLWLANRLIAIVDSEHASIPSLVYIYISRRWAYLEGEEMTELYLNAKRLCICAQLVKRFETFRVKEVKNKISLRKIYHLCQTIRSIRILVHSQ